MSTPPRHPSNLLHNDYHVFFPKRKLWDEADLYRLSGANIKKDGCSYTTNTTTRHQLQALTVSWQSSEYKRTSHQPNKPTALPGHHNPWHHLYKAQQTPTDTEHATAAKSSFQNHTVTSYTSVQRIDRNIMSVTYNWQHWPLLMTMIPRIIKSWQDLQQSCLVRCDAVSPDRHQSLGRTCCLHLQG
jgi:hypothetical protein